MPFAVTSISFWRSYCNVDDFCGSSFSENYLENALSREICFFVFKHSLATNDGCAHNSQLSTCTTDGKARRMFIQNRVQYMCIMVVLAPSHLLMSVSAHI